MIGSAVAAAGRAVDLMVDTADLVVNTEEGQWALAAAVLAAIDHGASVVVTSRPAEPQLLPGAWLGTTHG